MLEKTILNHVEVHLQGLIVNLGVGGEAYHSSFRDSFNNSFMTVCAKELTIEGQSKYFESKLKVCLQDFLVEDMTAVVGKELDFSKISREAFETLRKDTLITSSYKNTQNPETMKSNRKVRETTIEEEEEKEKNEKVGVRFDETSKVNPNDQGVSYLDEVEMLLGQKINSEPMGQVLKNRTSTKTEDKNKPKSHLMVNFIGADEETDCFVMKVRTIKEEYNKFANVWCLENKITIKMAAVVFVANPKVFSNIQWVVYYGSQFADERFKNFEGFMKDEAFWPEINMELNTTGRNPVLAVPKKEDNGHPLAKLELEIPHIDLIMMHDDEPLYFLNLTSINMGYTGNLKSSNLIATAHDLTLKNISRAAGFYPDLAQKIKHEKGKDNKVKALLLEVRQLDEDEAQVRGYSSEISVKLNEMNIVYLNRVVQEITRYLLDYLFKSLEGHDVDFDGKAASSKDEKAAEERSDSKFSLLILKSLVKLPRNSRCEEFFMVRLEKAGLWSTGKWGEHCGKLIETGFFDFEKEEDDNDEDEFEDVAENEEELKTLEKEIKEKRVREGKLYTETKLHKQKKNIPESDELRVLIEGIQIMDKLNDSEKSDFASFAEKKSVEVLINITDKKFSLQSFAQPEPPIKSN